MNDCFLHEHHIPKHIMYNVYGSSATLDQAKVEMLCEDAHIFTGDAVIPAQGTCAVLIIYPTILTTKMISTCTPMCKLPACEYV
jgi:hypothetical protein